MLDKRIGVNMMGGMRANTPSTRWPRPFRWRRRTRAGWRARRRRRRRLRRRPAGARAWRRRMAAAMAQPTRRRCAAAARRSGPPRTSPPRGKTARPGGQGHPRQGGVRGQEGRTDEEAGLSRIQSDSWAKTARCPSCGAPVEFKSVASILAVCDYCQSTLIRHGEDLENLGKMADLIEDPQPLAARRRRPLARTAISA